MNRTFKFVTLGVVMAVAIVMFSMALTQLSVAQDYSAASLADIEEHPGYELRDCSGYVGVYYKDNGYVAYVTDIPMQSLRGVDREQIEAGYAVGTRTELMQVLEDLGS